MTPISSPDPALVELGQMLFFDRELSGNRDVSCATCHHPDFGTGDGLALSVGTGGSGSGPARQLGPGREFVPRNAVELYNRGLPEWETMFWDARVSGSPETGYTTPAGDLLPPGLDSVLAAQAMFPVTFRDEMRGGFYDIQGYAIQPGETIDPDTYTPEPAGWHDVDVFGQINELAPIPNDAEYNPEIWAGIIDRLLAIPAYQDLFAAAYPDIPLDELGFQHAANALAAFQVDAFSLINSPWDRYLAGETNALSGPAKEGALLFYGPAGCAACHSGSLFTDQQFYNLGVPQYGPGTDAFAPLDYGRYQATGDEADQFKFRTPTLRNVALTAPYFHNGAYADLEEVIRHHLDPVGSLRTYDGRQLPPALQKTLQDSEVTIELILVTLSPELAVEQELTGREINQLIAFLESLTDPAAKDLQHLVPDAVPSGLPPLP
jgi:cytochrome c peroxidase